jgi:hypothetical protein
MVAFRENMGSRLQSESAPNRQLMDFGEAILSRVAWEDGHEGFALIDNLSHRRLVRCSIESRLGQSPECLSKAQVTPCSTMTHVGASLKRSTIVPATCPPDCVPRAPVLCLHQLAQGIFAARLANCAP